MEIAAESAPALTVFLGPLLALAVIAAFFGPGPAGVRGGRRPSVDGQPCLWIGVLALCAAGLLDAGGLISSALFAAACRVIVAVTIVSSLVLWARKTPESAPDDETPPSLPQRAKGPGRSPLL